MNKKGFLLIIFLCLGSIINAQEQKKFKVMCVAFYNVENLFDTINDPRTLDDDRTPLGRDKWTKEKYEDKIKNISRVISEIGADLTQTAPVIVGLSEIENRKVLEDLISHDFLKQYNYGIIQFNSPDRRGIDVALLYQKQYFTPSSFKAHELFIYDNVSTKRIFTRDQLLVSGFLDGEKIHFLVNHWPSRSGGEKRSSYKREAAANLSRKIIDSLQHINPYAKIISMGDFNDNPDNKSLSTILKAKETKNINNKELYNPMAAMQQKGYGTSAYRDNWSVFDQVIVSASLLSKDYSSYQFYKAGIFSKKYLFTSSGQYKGYPFRSYGYKGYTGGFSDHFPVYLYLIKEIEK